MTFGEAMYFDGDSTDLAYLREVTDKIMARIQELSGQEYVDEYAVKAKKPGAKPGKDGAEESE
jgi:1-acyl-sn-glycerol-3-phosphate acyltransferase